MHSRLRRKIILLNLHIKEKCVSIIVIKEVTGTLYLFNSSNTFCITCNKLFVFKRNPLLLKNGGTQYASPILLIKPTSKTMSTLPEYSSYCVYLNTFSNMRASEAGICPHQGILVVASLDYGCAIYGLLNL